MRQDDKRSRSSRAEGSGRTRGESQGRSAQRRDSRSSARQGGNPQQERRQSSSGRQAASQRRPEGRQSGTRRAAAGFWPDRLEAEQRKAQERKEQEQRRQLKLQRKRKARIRKLLALFTAALFGTALFLAVKLVKNWTAEPGKNQEKIDIEKLAEKDEYPESLLKLLEKNPETKDFVMNYPKNKDKHVDIDISKEVTKGEIPLFLQWDERWGYETYGDDFLALTGCGPTCLSMVRCGLSGDSTWNPYKTARMAENGGYYVSGSGSSWDLMTQGAAELGLIYEEVIFDEEHIRAVLEAGTPIICVVGPGDFTDNGHFLVLTGVDEEGKITLNDPNSKIRSREAWDISQLMSQIKNLWAYSCQGTEGE